MFRMLHDFSSICSKRTYRIHLEKNVCVLRSVLCIILIAMAWYVNLQFNLCKHTHTNHSHNQTHTLYKVQIYTVYSLEHTNWGHIYSIMLCMVWHIPWKLFRPLWQFYAVSLFEKCIREVCKDFSWVGCGLKWIDDDGLKYTSWEHTIHFAKQCIMKNLELIFLLLRYNNSYCNELKTLIINFCTWF